MHWSADCLHSALFTIAMYCLQSQCNYYRPHGIGKGQHSSLGKPDMSWYALYYNWVSNIIYIFTPLEMSLCLSVSVIISVCFYQYLCLFVSLTLSFGFLFHCSALFSLCLSLSLSLCLSLYVCVSLCLSVCIFLSICCGRVCVCICLLLSYLLSYVLVCPPPVLLGPCVCESGSTACEKYISSGFCA